MRRASVYHRYYLSIRRAILIIIYEEIGILLLLLYENVMVVGTYDVVHYLYSYLCNKMHYWLPTHTLNRYCIMISIYGDGEYIVLVG